MKKYLLSFTLLTLLSLLVFRFEILNAGVFFALAVVTLVLSIKKLEYGVLILAGELLIGSKGHLFWFDLGEQRISIRMVLFGIVMLCWLISLIRKKELPKLIKHKAFLYVLPFLIVLGYAVLNGIFVQKFSAGQVFADANNWLYILVIFPLWDVVFENESLSERGCEGQDESGNYNSAKNFLRKIFGLTKSAIVFLISKAFLFFIVFALSIPGLTELLYHFERQTGGGQMTPAIDGMWRIYFWSEIFLIPVLFIMLGLIYRNFANKNTQMSDSKALRRAASTVSDRRADWRPRAQSERTAGVRERPESGRLCVLCFAIIFTIILTLFRSFWVGAIAGLIIWVAILIIKKPNYKALFKTLTITLVLTIISISSIQLIGTGLAKIGNTSPTIQKELFNTGEPGIQNRLNQLQPLLQKIKQKPILGNGFGATATYESLDPRTKGKVTTTAFELGWLDMAMEVGVLGVLLFFVIMIYSVVLLWQWSDKLNINYAVHPLIATLVAVTAIHFFSPFLNHPLGLGLIIFIFVYANQNYAVQHHNNFSRVD